MVGYDHPQHSSALTFSFTGRHFLSELILQSVRYYISYKLSYREIKKLVASSWRMDETYINVKGQRSKVKGQRSKVNITLEPLISTAMLLIFYSANAVMRKWLPPSLPRQSAMMTRKSGYR
ncbi:hypothetical protein VCR4J5_1600037 [Vibrio crassostreae]|uniref:Transposase n=1 Tax=Vibrio crassostreae TaxID=246167 RepID=A0ABM9QR71_9VIBR|nr:hypothetical protein VCR4J5_1600037 [Vibrio crassostreae]CDT37633.1 hypothetical protein VCR19J5_240037 [Vibrio crassostreae]